MNRINLGLIREGKIPHDKRTALAPKQASKALERFEGLKIFAQSSGFRCFSDNEYASENIEVTENMEHCDVLCGVKEVPIDQLIPDKTYLFFSHTIKKQHYNRKLLQAILAKNIRLIDYECLTDTQGNRVIAFGRYAGLVGAYNGIFAYGKKSGLFDLKRAQECFDLKEMLEEVKKAKLPPIKIVLTGTGRVGKGAQEVLAALQIKQISPEEFLHESYDFPVYTVLNSEHYHRHKDHGGFDKKEFYSYPENYMSDFLPFAQKADVLMAAAYWHPKAPVLFTNEDMKSDSFGIKVIADITCDIEGSIPSTLRASTIDQPLYDYNPFTGKEEPALSSTENITVMAIDNLPCELPRDASLDFGKELLERVLPALIENDAEEMIKRATICENGQLTERFLYLEDYVAAKNN